MTERPTMKQPRVQAYYVTDVTYVGTGRVAAAGVNVSGFFRVHDASITDESGKLLAREERMKKLAIMYECARDQGALETTTTLLNHDRLLGVDDLTTLLS